MLQMSIHLPLTSRLVESNEHVIGLELTPSHTQNKTFQESLINY